MVAPTKVAIRNRFRELPEEIREYFVHFENLISDFPWDVTISYAFSLVETAHNRTIYGGVLKLHKVEKSMAWLALDRLHMTRRGFRERYETIFGQGLPQRVVESIASAEVVRDKILHGKSATEAEKRQAVMDILDYSEEFNDEVYNKAGFTPFGSMQGFKGRGSSHNRETSRWILKGMGFALD